MIVCIGDTESEFQRRASAVTAVTGMSADEVRQHCIAGTTSQARAVVERWNTAGAQRLHLLPVDHTDFDHLDIVAASLK